MISLESYAKEKSNLITKAVFRLLACFYLGYEGYFRMIRGHFTDPEQYPISALVFGAVFLTGAVAYGAFAAWAYLRDAKQLKADYEAAKDGQASAVETENESEISDKEEAAQADTMAVEEPEERT